jgi:hypothetical protein
VPIVFGVALLIALRVGSVVLAWWRAGHATAFGITI